MEERDALLSNRISYGTTLYNDNTKNVEISINPIKETNEKSKTPKDVILPNENKIDTTILDKDKGVLVKSKYNMKNHMANERTFFKYLFTGIHIGGIGTLVLSYFSTDNITKIYLVLFIWIIAFCFMFWGLYNYYKRKWMMESGLFKVTSLLNPHTPAIVTATFIYIVLLILIYAILSKHYPSKHNMIHNMHQGNATISTLNDGSSILN